MPLTTTESGEHLKRLRKQAGLTQEQLAAEVGCQQPWVSHVELGREKATLDYGWKVAQVLGLGLRRRDELMRMIAEDRGDLGAYEEWRETAAA